MNFFTFDFDENNRWYKLCARMLSLLMFATVGYFTIYLIVAICILQLLFDLCFAKKIIRLENFSLGLNAYLHQIAQFMTGNTTEKPFPFTEWPVTDIDNNVDNQAKTNDHQE